MDLIEFKPGQRRGDQSPTLSVSPKGWMRFNRPAVEKLGLEAGMRMVFYQDKKDPLDWYFKLGDDGAKLRKEHQDKGCLVFNFSIVAKKILAALKKDTAVLVRVATTPVDGVHEGYYAILTRSA